MQKIGNWDKAKEKLSSQKTVYGWNKADVNLLDSSRIEKIQQKWEKLPQQVDAYMVLGPKIHNFQQIGRVSEEWVRDNLKITPEQWQGPNEDVITVFFTQNRGGSKIPMTPWILAHRFGHGIRGSAQRGNPYFYELLNNTLSFFQKMAKRLYFPDNSYYNQYIDVRKTDQAVMAMLNKIGTFRSARNNSLVNEYEFLYDCFAQYIITGKITFNDLPRTIEYGKRYWGKSSQHYSSINDEPLYQELNQRLHSYAKALAQEFNIVLDDSLGEIFVM